MEPLLIRFKRDQRTFIRKSAKKRKESEAAFVRGAVENIMQSKEASNV